MTARSSMPLLTAMIPAGTLVYRATIHPRPAVSHSYVSLMWARAGACRRPYAQVHLHRASSRHLPPLLFPRPHRYPCLYRRHYAHAFTDASANTDANSPFAYSDAFAYVDAFANTGAYSSHTITDAFANARSPHSNCNCTAVPGRISESGADATGACGWHCDGDP